MKEETLLEAQWPPRNGCEKQKNVLKFVDIGLLSAMLLPLWMIEKISQISM